MSLITAGFKPMPTVSRSPNQEQPCSVSQIEWNPKMAADKIFSRSSKSSLQMFIQQICRLQSRQREIVEHSNIIYNRQKETTWLEFGSKKN